MTPAPEKSLLHDTGWRLVFHPALPAWLLYPAAALTIVLVIYLYHYQRLIAPPRIVATLGALRLILVGLLVLLLFSPQLHWTRVEHSPGTLWLVLDHSESMAFHDPQATSVERLRWACALGYIPHNVWSDALDRDLAGLLLLRERLEQYRLINRQASFNISAREHGLEQSGLAVRLDNWRRRLSHRIGLIASYGGTAAVRTKLANLAKMTRHAVQDLESGGTSAGGSPPPPFASMLAALDSAMRQLDTLAKSRDELFLRRRSTRALARLALNRVASMSRARLAVAMLTNQKIKRPHELGWMIRHEPVRIVSFAGSSFLRTGPPAGSVKAVLTDALSPSGNTTNLAAGMTAVADHLLAHGAATVVLVSDGRQNIGPDPSPIARLLAERGVRTFTICIGSSHAPPGASIKAIAAPHWIFKRQRMKAVALIHLRELAKKSVTVELLRGHTVVQTHIISTPSADRLKKVQLSNRPPGPGVYRYAIRILPIAGVFHPRAMTRRFRVTVRRDKLQVLLIDNQPSWEYQYLVNDLSRNPRVHLQAVVLHPEWIRGVTPPPLIRASPKNAGYQAQKLPNTKTGWAAFDIIILGDVPPKAFTPLDQQALAATVRNNGSALVLVAGGRYMPQAWAGTPLAALIPVKLRSAWPPDVLLRQEQRGFTPALTPEGTGSELSQLGLDRRANSRLWRAMPRWYWHSAYTDARSVARVLWTISSTKSNGGARNSLGRDRRRALLATMTVGAGRSLYLAGDQTWRLRYVNGHNIQNNFWSQVLRWAAGVQLPAGGKYVRFGTARAVYTTGRAVRVQARVLGKNLLPDSGLRFQAVAMSIAAGHAPAKAAASPLRFTAPMIAEKGAPGFYNGSLTGLSPGKYKVFLRGGGVGRRLRRDPTAVARSITIRVRAQPNLELADTSSDPRALERLALAGDGLMVPGPFADLLARHLPALRRTFQIPEQTGFFINPRSRLTLGLQLAFLTLFVIIITIEWVIRKRAGLV